MASDLAEAYLSNVSHRTNEIMKVLTLMASIFIPLTFVAGIYGMNFQNMPELSSRVGYFVVLVVMGVIAVAMVAYFRHRGWIGSPRPPTFGGRRSGRDRREP
jgi:magnesium transporter